MINQYFFIYLFVVGFTRSRVHAYAFLVFPMFVSCHRNGDSSWAFYLIEEKLKKIDGHGSSFDFYDVCDARNLTRSIADRFVRLLTLLLIHSTTLSFTIIPRLFWGEVGPT